MRQRELGLTWFIPDTIEGIAGLETLCGHPQRALQLAGAAFAVREELSVPAFPLKRDLVERWLSPLRQAVGNDAAARGWAEGAALSLDAAVSLALARADSETISRSPSAEAWPGPLTPRQLAVAVLVAQGLTNRQIAKQLIITERGVAAHIEHILNKLSVGSRTQIGVWVAGRGLLAATRIV